MKHRFLPLCALILLYANAQAQTISYQFGLPIIQSTTEINQSGNLGLFNSNLGTLTGASLELFGAGTTSGSLTNGSLTTENISALVRSRLIFNSSISELNSLVTQPANNVLLEFPVAVQSYTAGQTRNYGPLTDSENITLNLDTILANLQAPGGGTFSVGGLSISGITITGGGGNTSSTQNTTAGLGAKITYTYTPFSVIPEPSQAISTLALCTFGLMLRRRAAKR
jgi:hypothetical protein